MKDKPKTIQKALQKEEEKSLHLQKILNEQYQVMEQLKEKHILITNRMKKAKELENFRMLKGLNQERIDNHRQTRFLEQEIRRTQSELNINAQIIQKYKEFLLHQ